jgi:hypothetical protein
MIWQRWTGASTVPALIQQNAAGEIRFAWVRASGGTNTSYITNNAGLVAGKWFFIGVTFDPAGSAGARAQIYVGTESVPALACTFGTNTDAASLLSNAATPFAIGGVSGSLASFLGRIANQMLWPNRVLTMQQMRNQQRTLNPISAGCKLVCRYQDGPNRAWDVSGAGNHGTLQSSVPSMVNPAWMLARTIRRKWFDVPAAAAGSSIVPIVLRQFRTRWAA